MEVREPSASTPATLARELLVACKRGTATEAYASALASLDDADLERVRTDRETALAFWLNCYNAGTQLLLDDRPALYESPLRVVRFFRTPALTVGGTPLSLGRIENGLLRGGRSKYGLGYLPKLHSTSFERRYRLSSLDPRIHFALNCGAASCPAIRAYEPDAVDEQLDLATRTYLDATVTYDADGGVVRVPRVFLWYRGDFGGGAGIRRLLREYGIVPADASPSIRHRAWDWSKTPGKFVA
ncbi:DUF547 domain-containing protein [Haloplanus natans]|uniref:DUF547 domain-containing protein n=1 Tax=Haloplanus natans TaxID=376171 RepID=UPI000677C6CF|nr:DUF547 domain-containing protein [Haloplanus natans]